MATKYIVNNVSGQTINVDLKTFSINPAEDNKFNFGNSDFRWKSITLGTGTLYMVDTITGLSCELTVSNGVLLVNGVSLLGTAGITFLIDGTIQTTAYDPTQLQILHNDLQLQDGNDNITIQLITDGNGIGKIIFGGSSTMWINNGFFVDGVQYKAQSTSIKPLSYNTSTKEISYDSTTIPFTYTSTIPIHSYGVVGDIKNNFTYDGTYLYICTENYQGDAINIWKRILWTAGTW